MKFKGKTVKDLTRSEAQWQHWRATMQSDSSAKPVLRFAERWVELMEGQARARQTQVRNMAEATMIEAGGRALTREQISSIVLILHKCWYLGSSLRAWAVERGLLDPAD